MDKNNVLFYLCVLSLGFGFAGWVQAVDITSNLEAYYKFDEGVGQTAHDSSGMEKHATFNGDPTWVRTDWADWGGSVLAFDGDDYLRAPNLFDIGTGEVTYSYLVKQTDTSDWQYNISNKDNFSDHFFKAGFNQNDGHLRFYTEQDNNVKTTFVTDEPYTGRWVHVVVTLLSCSV